MSTKDSYQLTEASKEMREGMYGNIESEDVDPQMYECSCAICDCACFPGGICTEELEGLNEERESEASDIEVKVATE